MTSTRRRTSSLLALVAVLGLGATACGSSDDAGAEATTSSSSASSSSTSSTSSSSSSAMADTTPVGAGCAGYVAQVPTGAGSVEGMAEANVTTAASNNPLLTTLVAAVSGQLNPQVNLVDTLNGGEFTVFAPVDSAFAALPPETVATLKTPEGTDTLTSVLTYHVVQGRMDPAMLLAAKSVPTVQGASVEIGGTADAMTVNGSTKVICGNVQTSNATVYLVDAVLMPPA
ncbi:fasciclin domain-containing protein [Kineococcus sp. R8]|uniref:fasciclin domain-containing protein n=1 Tax=Kineococcus siccus TaxID=2696567 RepID=UPI001413743B|nr:fasciclin domain-containing protein [Kineococcus siccus]NAZ81868.1 fasciclin domain-containing protein [Kineococcus siccus]